MKGDTHTFRIPVKPVGKKRPRFVVNKKTGRGSGYDVNKTEEGKMLLFCLNQWGGREPITGAVRLDCELIFARPKSHYGTGRNAGKLKPSAQKYHTQKPDCDNCWKLLADALNGVVYKDDAQVIGGEVFKRWGEPGEPDEIVLVLEELE